MSASVSVPRVMVGFDGSPPAVAAIEVGSALLAGARATVVFLWTPPFASGPLRHRLRERSSTMDDLTAMLECEGAAEAEQMVRTGRVLAEAGGWTASTLVTRSFGGDGARFAALAEEHGPDLVLLGTRGLAGLSAVADSFADTVVHHSPVPVLVVPHPLLTDDRERAASGPAAVGWDGSPGAARALRVAGTVLPGRELVTLAVGAEASAGTGTVAPAAVAEQLGRPVRQVSVPGPSWVPGLARGTARELILAADRERAGLLVVGSRGRSGWREVLLGSTAMAVLHHAHLPVLVVPSPLDVYDEPVAQQTDTPPRERAAATVPHER